MHLSHTFPTSYGRRRSSPARLIRVTIWPSELYLLIRNFARDARELEIDCSEVGADALPSGPIALRETMR
jgi:hypothetical protein